MNTVQDEIRAENILTEGELNVVVKGRHGLTCVNKYSPIGRSYMFYGEHAENEIDFCRKFIPEGGSILDVGAHQGTHTLAFSKAVGSKGNVVSIEPQRQMFQNILATTALNSLSNVYAINSAVGENMGVARIVEFDYGQRGHFSGMSISEENTGETVSMTTLDDVVIQTEKLHRVDFVKIDVEGYELNVLKGSTQLIKQWQPVIYHEFHSDSSCKDGVIEFMKSVGYETYLHIPVGFNKDNYFGYPDDRFRGGKDFNAISLHASSVEKYSALLAQCKSVS